MPIAIEIFNDVVTILESIVHMEDDVSEVSKTGKLFIKDFKAGNTQAAQKDCDDLATSLGKLEKVFSAETLPAVMDIYQKLKHGLSQHVLMGEKHMLELESQLQIKPMKALADRQDKFLKEKEGCHE